MSDPTREDAAASEQEPKMEGMEGGLDAEQDKAVEVHDFAVPGPSSPPAEPSAPAKATAPRSLRIRPQASARETVASPLSPGSTGRGTPPSRVGTPVDREAWNVFINQYSTGQMHALEFPLGTRDQPHTVRTRKSKRHLGSTREASAGPSLASPSASGSQLPKPPPSAPTEGGQTISTAAVPGVGSAGYFSSDAAQPSPPMLSPPPHDADAGGDQDEEFTDQHRNTSPAGAANQDPEIPDIPLANLPRLRKERKAPLSRRLPEPEADGAEERRGLTREHMAQLLQEQKDAAADDRAYNESPGAEADAEETGEDQEPAGSGGSRARRRRTRPPLDVELGAERRALSAGSSAGSESPEDGEKSQSQIIGASSRASRASRRPPMPARSKQSYRSKASVDHGPDIVPFHEIAGDSGTNSSTSASHVDVDFDYATERDRVREFFEKHGYMPAPRQPPDAARRRLRVIRRLGLEKPDELHRTTLDRFTRLAVSIFGTSKAIVSVIGKDRQIFLSEIGMGAKSTSFEEAFCCHTIIGAGEACLIVPDAGKDWRFSKNPLVKEGKGIVQFYAGAPLRIGEGSKAAIIGSMCIIDDKPKHDFDAKGQRLLQDLAECVVSELELLYTQRATVESAKLHQISVEFLRRSLKHRPNERAGRSRQTGTLTTSTTDNTSSAGSQHSDKKRNQGADHKQSDEDLDIFDEACQEIRSALDAHAVAIVDLSQFHLFYPAYQTSTQAGGSTTGSTARPKGQSSQAPTLSGAPGSFSSSVRGGDGPGSGEEDPYQRSFNGKAARKTYSVIDPMATSRTPQVLFVPSNNSTFGRTSKAANIDASSTLPILGYSSGHDDFAFNFSASPAGRKVVCDFIARNVKGRTVWYSRDDSEGIAESINRLMPPGTEASLAMPVFGFDGQVAFAVVACWTDPLFTYPAGALQFVETIAGSLLASVMKERLHQAERAQLNFAAAASHELRTPLHQINAAAALLRQTIQSSLTTSPRIRPPLLSSDSDPSQRPNHIQLTQDDRKEAANHLEVIEANGVALGQILENIIDTLDIGRSTTAVPKTHPPGQAVPLAPVPEEMHNLSDVLEGVVKDAIMNETKARRVAGEKGLEDVEILLEIMPRIRGSWIIATDPGPLSRALSKIIHNACKFTDKGYIHITVQDASRDVVLPGGYNNPVKLSQVVIDIKDTGRGMSADFLDQTILRPFAKADPFKQGAGLGLGLAQRMIEILGGKLAIKSVLNKGTLVHVEIPLHLMNGDNDSDAENMAEQEEHYVQRPTSPVRTDGIYLAGFMDGDAGVRRVGRTLLRQLKLRFCRVVDDSQFASLIVYPEGRLSAEELGDLRARARPGVEEIALASAAQAATSWPFPTTSSGSPPPRSSSPKPPGSLANDHNAIRLSRPLMPSVIRRIVQPPARVEAEPERYVSDVVGGDEARQERQDRASSISSALEQQVLPSSPDGRSLSGSVHALSDHWSTSAGSQPEDIPPATTAPSQTHTAASSQAEIPLSPPAKKQYLHGYSQDQQQQQQQQQLPRRGRPLLETHLTELTDPKPTKSPELHDSLSRLSLKHTQSDPPARTAVPTAGLSAPMRVLVVEDNSVNRRIVVTMLKRTACHYAEAVDGDDAVRQFMAFDPDLVLLDINMPIKDGFQASTEMRAMEAKRGGVRRAKIIAVTALSQEHSKRKGMLECGIDEWRTKPVSLKTLKEDVEKMKA